MNLINYDVDDAIAIDDAGTMGLSRATFGHELAHDWQVDHGRCPWPIGIPTATRSERPHDGLAP